MLLVPLHFPRRGIEGQRAVRVDRIALGSARELRPRFGLRGAPIYQPCFRIVAAGDPRIGARAKSQRQLLPRLSTRLARARNGRGPPQFSPRLGIVAGDEADVLLIPL